MASGSPTEHFNNSAAATTVCSTMCPATADEVERKSTGFSSSLFQLCLEMRSRPGHTDLQSYLQTAFGRPHHVRAELEPRFYIPSKQPQTVRNIAWLAQSGLRLPTYAGFVAQDPTAAANSCHPGHRTATGWSWVRATHAAGKPPTACLKVGARPPGRAMPCHPWTNASKNINHPRNQAP